MIPDVVMTLTWVLAIPSRAFSFCSFPRISGSSQTMPKNTQNSIAASRHSLRRNQACLTCRKRKLVLIFPLSLPLALTIAFRDVMLHVLTVPPASMFIYPVEGLPLAPDADPVEKIKELEKQVVPQSPSHLRPPSSHHFHQSPSSGSVTLSPDLEPCGITAPSPWHHTAADLNAVSSGSPEVLSRQPVRHSDSLTGLIYSGWNPDLPEPDVLDH
ncbi:hypothetical protein EDB89DRAFT_2241094 [Lactarius sanguifluus]|nr:hypothetical protein EDB89DRAFT_2241094 [Lactarius sanguifluus]